MEFAALNRNATSNNARSFNATVFQIQNKAKQARRSFANFDKDRIAPQNRNMFQSQQASIIRGNRRALHSVGREAQTVDTEVYRVNSLNSPTSAVDRCRDRSRRFEGAS